jgi:hypothetical protein
MSALVDKVGHGRAAESRPPTRQELATTAVLALPLEEVSVRARTGGVVDDPADLSLPHWAGVLPLRRVAGPPEPDAGVTPPPPAYLPGADVAVAHRGADARPARRLEPLAPGHADGLIAALGDDEVWQFLPTRGRRARRRWPSTSPTCPRAVEGGAGAVGAVSTRRTGEVIGMTSYHDIDPERRRSASATPSSDGAGGAPG